MKLKCKSKRQFDQKGNIIDVFASNILKLKAQEILLFFFFKIFHRLKWLLLGIDFHLLYFHFEAVKCAVLVSLSSINVPDSESIVQSLVLPLSIGFALRFSIGTFDAMVT